MYWAVTKFNADAGIEVTASHNPIEYNGMKIVKKRSQPLTDYEFSCVKKFIEEGADFSALDKKFGLVLDKEEEARAAYLEKILSFLELKSLKSIRIVINSGNGAAGPVVDALKEKLHYKGVKTDFVHFNMNPDPEFPNGIPNPLLKENRSSTSDFVKMVKADLGVAFDGDFDRCFIFDHMGNYISGEYVIGMISQIFLTREKGSSVIHDPRTIWNTVDVVNRCGGRAVMAKTGHSFVKAAMREEKAIYGGELSAHHYFRDFAYCDSGMIPWLLIWQLISETGIKIADLISERKLLFPSSGEINFEVNDTKNCLKVVNDFYQEKAENFDYTDGISMTFSDWRFNLRRSNTEPLVRLNIETRGNYELLKNKTKELTNLII